MRDARTCFGGKPRNFTTSGWSTMVISGAMPCNSGLIHTWALGPLCLSGCFSKPLGVVSGSASSVLSQDSSPVSASVRQRRGLPRVPCRVPLVRRLQVPPMRARSRLRAGGTKTLAVRRLSSPSVPDIGDNPSQYEDPADPLVLGGLPDDDR